MLISRLAITLAVAEVEGWFDPIHEPLRPAMNRPQRNNNPGDLEWASPRFPQLDEKDGVYCCFTSHLSGWAALENDIYAKILHIDPETKTWWNLAKLLSVYAPAGDGSNDPVAYAKTVAAKIKTDALVPLRNVVLEEGRILGPWVSGPQAGPPRPDWGDIVGWAIKAGIHRT